MNSQPFLSADTTTELLTGRITHYNTKKKYGFIKTEVNQSFFFYFNIREQIELMNSGIKNALRGPRPGDVVEFQLRPNLRDNTKMVAYNLVYLRNFFKEQLMQHAEENKILKGTLVQQNDAYFIKHPDADILIRVLISEWETDLNLTYADRINNTVEFTVNPGRHFNALGAILTDRRFCKEYVPLLQLQASDNTTTAVITQKIWRGIHATILDGTVNAFATFPKEFSEEQRNHFFRFNAGDKVKVKIKAIRKSKRVSITIAE